MSTGLASSPDAGDTTPQLAAPAPALPADCACEVVRTEDLSCPICFETLCDPFVTSCGHTFCYGCISQHLQHAKNCPSCSRFLTTELIHPNFLLSKVRQLDMEFSIAFQYMVALLPQQLGLRAGS